MTDPSPNLSLKALFSGISADVQLLAAQTTALARLEASTAASKLAWSAVAGPVSIFIAIRRSGRPCQCARADRDRPRAASMGRFDARRCLVLTVGGELSPRALCRCHPASRLGPERDTSKPSRDDGMAESSNTRLSTHVRMTPRHRRRQTSWPRFVFVSPCGSREPPTMFIRYSARRRPPPRSRTTGDAIERAIKAIAIVGRTKRAWDHARRTGVLRRGAAAPWR